MADMGSAEQRSLRRIFSRMAQKPAKSPGVSRSRPMAAGQRLTRAFLARARREVAPARIGGTLQVDGGGGVVVEVEGDQQTP
ncbi:MAG: hypothetical protein ACK495_32275, partial [Bradyrhizobium sp.]